MKRAIGTALLLAGCGQPPPNVSVDPQLKPYFNSFESNIGGYTADISAQFADTENQPNPLGETVAECMVYDDGAKLIQVDPNFWNTANEDQREQTIFHELGHCSLGLKHITTLQNNGCPVSIMYPYAFGDPCYTTHHEYYMGELASHR